MQQWLREDASTLHYTYFASLVTPTFSLSEDLAANVLSTTRNQKTHRFAPASLSFCLPASFYSRLLHVSNSENLNGLWSNSACYKTSTVALVLSPPHQLWRVAMLWLFKADLTVPEYADKYSPFVWIFMRAWRIASFIFLYNLDTRGGQPTEIFSKDELNTIYKFMILLTTWTLIICVLVFGYFAKNIKLFFSGLSGLMTLIMQKGHFVVFASRSLCYTYIDHPELRSRSTNNDTEQCVVTFIEVQENQFPQVNIEFLKVNYELQPKFHIKLSSNLQFLRLPNCQTNGLLYNTSEDYYLTTLGKSSVPVFSHSDSVSHIAIDFGIMKVTINNLSQSDLQHSRDLICESLWSSGQSFWLQIQRSRVRLPALPDFLSSGGSRTGSTQPREVNWGATWIKSSGSGPENRD